MALRTSLQTGNTVALLIVEAEKQLCGLGESLLAAEHQLRTCPVYLLTVLLDHYGRRNESHRHYLDMRLVNLEDKMSISPLIYTNHSTRPLPLDDSQTVSEESIIQELHDNNTRLIWLSGTINYEITALDFVTVLLDRLRGMGDRSRVGSPASHTVMVEELRALKTGAELRQFQRQNLQQRAETRIAMVSSLLPSLLHGSSDVDRLRASSIHASPSATAKSASRWLNSPDGLPIPPKRTAGR